MASATIAASATAQITASEIHPFRILKIPWVIVPPFRFRGLPEDQFVEIPSGIAQYMMVRVM